MKGLRDPQITTLRFRNPYLMLFDQYSHSNEELCYYKYVPYAMDINPNLQKNKSNSLLSFSG